jgi:phosphonate transport system permease protein
MTQNLVLPSVKYKRKVRNLVIAAIITVVACIYLKFNPVLLFADFHYVQKLLGEMLPPNFSLLWQHNGILISIVQTIAMAFLATFYGCLLALVLAFLAAANAMPVKWIRTLFNGLIAFIRLVPSLVYILVFIIAVGLGVFSGTLALIAITVGTFGKLFTDIIEHSEPAAEEAIYSVGASRLQVLRYAVFPQVLPAFIANGLYAFDTNIRVGIALGIFGGGGIGYELYLAMQVLHYHDVTAIISLIILLVVLAEKLSDYLRKRILGEGKLK